MKVLVTGATGPFGRAVCRRLAASGHEVTAMARRTPSTPTDGVEFAQGDVRDVTAVRAAMQGCDAVVHLAWVVAPLKTEAETAAINLGGTRSVLDAMADTGCGRLVFSSSVLAYGAVPGHPPFLKEDDERRPEAHHYYAAHKMAAEDMIIESGVDSVLVRSGIIAGRDVDNTIFRFFSSPALPVPDPERTQQFVHTDDVARFTAEAVSSDRTGPVNITGEGAVTMREIAAIIDRPLVTVPERVLRNGIQAAWNLRVSELAPGEIGGLLYMPIVDTTRLREEWGFTCAWTSRAALTDLARAAHGRVTLGKKTVRVPWRVPENASTRVGRLGASVLRRTYADEVDRVVRDIADVEAQSVGVTDPLRTAATGQLLEDLARHATVLATLGREHGFDLGAVSRAETAAHVAQSGSRS
ncbi:MAG: NAD-dependent epimerase/dehydratase family protein [Rhodococcus fascians]